MAVASSHLHLTHKAESHHKYFCRPDALPAIQVKNWRHKNKQIISAFNSCLHLHHFWPAQNLQLIVSQCTTYFHLSFCSKVDPQLTMWWCKEVEEWVVLHGLHDRSLSSPAFVLLNFLDDFHRHVLALLPVNCASNKPDTWVPLKINSNMRSHYKPVRKNDIF